MVKIHEYGYRPRFVYQGTGSPKFGFELEVNYLGGWNELRGILARVHKYLKSKGFLTYFVQDSSTYNESNGEVGCEIVSHPFTFPYIVSKHAYIADALRALNHFGVRSYEAESCGFHVHVERGSFNSVAHITRFIKFFYEYKEATKLLADRPPGVLEEYASLSDLKQSLRYINEVRGPESHVAVNINCESTLEVRIYRGNLKPQRFFSSLEHVKSVYDFTKRGETMRDYFRFLKTHRNEYPNLCHYMMELKSHKPFKSFPITQRFRSPLLCA